MSADQRDPNLPPTAQPQPQPGPQQPYGQPQPPYGYPATPPAQAYGQGYGQPYQQAQGYPAAYTGYPPAAGYAAAPAQRRSPVLGIVGFGIVVVTGIIAILIGLMMADPMGAIIQLVPPGTTEVDVDTIPPELMEPLAGLVAGLGMAGFAGLIGWIISIVAAITNRGRGWAVAGIILGILAPIGALIAMSVAAVAAVA